MARAVDRGEIWTYRFKAPDKRRPVLVLSRPEVVPLLHIVMVAPITSTRRGPPSEVMVGSSEGLKQDGAVNLDHVQTVERGRLVGYLGSLTVEQMRQVCRALAIATVAAIDRAAGVRSGVACEVLAEWRRDGAA